MKTNILFLLLSFTLTGSAQHHLTIGAGGSYNTIKTDGLNSFASTFNSYHEGNGFLPLSDFRKGMPAFHISAGYRLLEPDKMSLAMIYMYSQNGQDNRTTLVQKSGYDVEYRAKTHDVLFELGYNTYRSNISAVLGLSTRHNTAEIWKVYTNGDRSLGYENDITGHYQTKSFAADVGGSLGFRIWKFYTPLRITYAIPLYQGADGLNDFDTYRLRSNELPKDYVQWVGSTTNYDTENFISQNDFMGWRVHFGIEYLIPLSKK